MKITYQSARNAPRTVPMGSMTLLAMAVMACLGATAASATPLLGSELASFTVLGASTVTNVPTSSITGDVGVWSSGGANAITGFNSAPGVAVSDLQVSAGTVQAGTETGTPNAKTAQQQLITAITDLGSLGPGTTVSADLTGLTLLPGVYTVPAGTTNLSGTLTLNGNGNANAAWVFQMPSSLITSPNSTVKLIDTGSGAGVYWNVGSSATIDTNTTFIGNILALASITMNSTATDLCGRALAETGAVTLHQNVLSGSCSGAESGSGAQSGGLSGGLGVSDTGQVGTLPYASVPEPASLALFFAGLLGLGYAATRKRASTPALAV